MLSVDDLIILPYTPDLTQAGIAYACQTPPDDLQRSAKDIFLRLRWIVIDQAAELAFRRHLSARNVPHKLAANSFFTGSRACAVIGGRYCDVYSFEIFRKEKIHQLHQNPASLLSASAVVPSQEVSTQQRSESDLLIFCFVTALITPNLMTIKRAASAGQPLSLIYPLPTIWSRRSNWTDLGRLTFKSDTNQTLNVTLGGQAEDRAFQTEEIHLPPLCKVDAHNIYYSLAFLQLTDIPSGRLGIHSAKLGKTIIIHPYEWRNVWVYGMRIYLVGWVTRGEFQRNAQLSQPDLSGWRPNSPGNKYLALPVSELRSMEELYSKAIDWDNR
jgi:hypothetical protein